MKFGCSLCDYTSFCKNSVFNHINKKKKCGIGVAEIIEIPYDIICKYCNKKFQTEANMNYHQNNNCDRMPNDISIPEIIQKIDKLESNNEHEKLKKEYEKLKEKYEKIEEELKEYKKLKMGMLSNIRSKARKKYTEYFELICVHCKNSDKTIIEICHIKPVSEFPLDATESEINALHNLISLCPNCHTGLDKSKNPEIIKTTKEHSEDILSLSKV